jgi:hypothetical protein
MVIGIDFYIFYLIIRQIKLMDAMKQFFETKKFQNLVIDNDTEFRIFIN